MQRKINVTGTIRKRILGSRIRSASISALIFFALVLVAEPLLMNRPLSVFRVTWMAMTAAFIGLIVYGVSASRDGPA